MSEFVKDLAAAQAEMGNAAFNRINPHFKSKYADLGAVRDATLPVLTKHGFAVIQTTEMIDGSLYLKTELAHKSGDSRSSFYPIAGGTPQQQGSALTYARRYSWSAICGIASEEDDDGNATEGLASKSKSAHAARKDGDYSRLQSEIRAAASVDKLKAWGKTEAHRIVDLPDSWRAHIRDEYERRLAELEEGVDEEGNEITVTAPSTLKQQLKASLTEVK